MRVREIRKAMRLLASVLVTAVWTAGNSPAQEMSDFARTLEGDYCPLALPDWATTSERYAWNQICAGYKADMTYATGIDDQAGCNALDGTQPWPQSRVLSARFIILIATREPYVSVMARRAVVISCARIDESINLYADFVPHSISIFDSRLSQDVNFSYSRFSGEIDLSGSRVDGILSAENAEVAWSINFSNGSFNSILLGNSSIGKNLGAANATFSGNVDASYSRVGQNVVFDGSSFSGDILAPYIEVDGMVSVGNKASLQGINLDGAGIVGDLVLNSSIISGPLYAPNAIIGGDLRVSSGASVSGVTLWGTTVGGNVSAESSSFRGQFDASDIKISGSLWMGNNSSFKDVLLKGASIGGNIEANESDFSGALWANSIKVSDHVLFSEGASFFSISLGNAEIGGSVHLDDASFSGEVDLIGLRAKDLSLWRGEGSDPIWRDDSRLILRNADVEALQARIPESWVRDDGTQIPLDLQGFRYDRLGGFGSGAEGDLSRIGDAAPLIAWIETAGDSGGQDAGHAPQPYFQMESVLRAMGAGPAADEVAYARHLHRMDHYGNTLRGWVAWAGEWVWRLLVGFGVYPFRLLWWFAALVVLGTILGRRTGALCTQGWSGCFWYSLENAFPLMEPGRRNRDLFHDHPGVRSFFHFQKIAGFVLGTILVGTLTLLGN